LGETSKRMKIKMSGRCTLKKGECKSQTEEGNCSSKGFCESREVPPPLCPKCGEPLDTIRIEENNIYSWSSYNPDGHYDIDDHSSGTILCSHCGEAIGGYGQHAWGFYPNFG